MEQMEIREESELQTAVSKTIQLLKQTPRAHASVVALSGDLGAGKTTFVKELAHALGIEEEVTSPTFVIMKLYPLEKAADVPYALLAHIDAYRIEAEDEMRVLRFDDLLAQRDALICIEWAEKIGTLIPKDALKIRIDIKGDTRVFTFS